MGLKHQLTRSLVGLLPSDRGLWRLRPFLPACPDPTRVVTRPLRGYPLRFRFRPGTYMGWFLYYRGMYEEDIVRTCARLLRPGMTFVDVGANWGLYTVVAAHRVGPGGRVLAFEPQAELAEAVDENIGLNGFSNVTVFRAALGEVEASGLIRHPSRTNDGAATLRVAEGESVFGEPVPVPVRVLPAVLADARVPRIDGMKIDVEGGELSVLRGMTGLLRERSPEFILFECIEPHLRRFQATTAQLFDHLQSYGYRLACHHRGRWRSVETLDDYRDSDSPPDLLAVHPETPTGAAAGKDPVFAEMHLAKRPTGATILRGTGTHSK